MFDTNTLRVPHLTAEAAHTGLADHAEQLRLSGMLMAQEAYAGFIINAHKAGVGCRKWTTSLEAKVNGQTNTSENEYVEFQQRLQIKLGLYTSLSKWEDRRFSHHTFQPFVWQSCWPSWSALLLLGHHRGPYLLLGSGHLPVKGKVMEGAVPRCKTMFEGHGAHKSDRGPPVHSSEREEYSFIWLVHLLIVCFESANKNGKTNKKIYCHRYCCYFIPTSRSQWTVGFGITRVWQGRVQKMISNRLTSAKQSESTNVWCSKPLREKTFAWSQKRHH